MHIDVVTIFPQMITDTARWGIAGRAQERGLWQLKCWNPRDYTTNPHRTIDDRPYGGGPGMVMLAEPLMATYRAIQLERMKSNASCDLVPISPFIYLSPQGSPLNELLLDKLSQYPRLTLLAGRYEGVDERFLQRYVTQEISIGDYVLSGGELAALVLIDSLVRRLPGALQDAQSAQEDSFVNGLLDCPHYTRPEKLASVGDVPAVLLSGDHMAIKRWRLKQALGRTWLRRPDLLIKRATSTEERELLDEFQREDSAP